MSPELLLAVAAFGLVAGAAAGLLGVGGGTLMVPFLVLAVGLSQHAAQATALMAVLPTAIVATVVLQRRGVGDLRRSMLIGGLGVAGALVGSALALVLPDGALRLTFAVFLGVIGVRMAREGWRATREASRTG